MSKPTKLKGKPRSQDKKVQRAFSAIRKGMSRMSPEERQKHDEETIGLFRILKEKPKT